MGIGPQIKQLVAQVASQLDRATKTALQYQQAIEPLRIQFRGRPKLNALLVRIQRVLQIPALLRKLGITFLPRVNLRKVAVEQVHTKVHQARAVVLQYQQATEPLRVQFRGRPKLNVVLVRIRRVIQIRVLPLVKDTKPRARRLMDMGPQI